MQNHFEFKLNKEYKDIKSLVSAAIVYGMIKSEDREAITDFLKETYKDGYFYEPTSIKFDKNGTIKIPLTIKAFEGIRRQWESEKNKLFQPLNFGVPDRNTKPKYTEVKPIFKPQSFNDIFVNPNHVSECLQLLKEPETPVIDEDNKFITNKGALVVWLQQLELKGMFKENFANDPHRAKTLMFNFKDLKISDGMFRRENKRANEDYKNYFAAQLSVIKTSKQ